MAVLVYAEQTEGQFKKSAFEVVSYARDIATNEGSPLIVLVIGGDDTNLSQLGRYGADKILHVRNTLLEKFNNQAYTSVIVAASEEEQANFVVLSNSFRGKDLAPAVAAKLKAGIVSGAIDLPDNEAGKCTVKKSTFSGKAIATVEILSATRVISLNPNSWSVKEVASQPSIQPYDPKLDNVSFDILVKDTIKSANKISLPEAEIVVSGGRGLKGPENWHLIEALADSLGAATACSKPVSDAGWRPHEEHVGQTGITISPNLYIAAGISGAIQHLAGVSSSKVLVAINKDPDAPIFKAADYGIVGDIFEVLPKLTDSVKSFKGSI